MSRLGCKALHSSVDFNNPGSRAALSEAMTSPDPTPIVTAYYVAARHEIDSRIRQRDQYVLLNVSAAGLVFGFVTSHTGWWGLLALLPLQTLLAGAFYF